MFAVLHVPSFALQAVQRTSTAPHTAPAALLSTDRRKPAVLETTASARAAGVTAGMTAPQALARCAKLIFHNPSAAAETDARQAVLACAFNLSPRIEDTAPGICTVDLTGARTSTRAGTCRTALLQLAHLGLDATAGLARTPWLALLAARAVCNTMRYNHGGTPDSSEPDDPETSNTIRYKPGGRVLEVCDERAFLAPLPIASAGPSEELSAVLAGWGLRTLGEFTAIPKAEISHRLGAAGLALWEHAAGLPVRPLRPVAPPREFAAAMDFEHEVETLEPLLFILRRFVDRLALDLANAGFVAAELTLRLALADETAHERSFRLPEPSGDPDILFRALHTHLESLHTGSPIAAAALRVAPARPLVQQQGLFDTGLRDPHGFAETLARTVALAGSGRVGTPRAEPTHRPDTFRIEPPASTVPPPAPADVHPPLGLPLRRFRPPIPAVVETAALQPATLDAGRVRGTVIARRGPWRTSGDWWQPAAWSRMEWDVELDRGGLYRLIRTRDGWFVEGEYD